MNLFSEPRPSASEVKLVGNHGFTEFIYRNKKTNETSTKAGHKAIFVIIRQKIIVITEN